MSVYVERPIVPGQLTFDERQAAQMLGISPWQLRQLRELRSVRIGRRRLWHRDDLERYAEKLRDAS